MLLREATFDDVEAVVELLHEVQQLDVRQEQEFNLDWVRGTVLFLLEVGKVFVVEIDGKLVATAGYAGCPTWYNGRMQYSDLFFCVHPHHRTFATFKCLMGSTDILTKDGAKVFLLVDNPEKFERKTTLFKRYGKQSGAVFEIGA